MTLKKYPLDGRRYYGEEKHTSQDIFLEKLHTDKQVHKKISNTIKNKNRNGMWINPMLGKHHLKKTKKEHSLRMKEKYASGQLIPHKMNLKKIIKQYLEM